MFILCTLQVFSSSSTRPLKELIQEAQTPRRSGSLQGSGSFPRGESGHRSEAVAPLASALAAAAAADRLYQGVVAEVERLDDVSLPEQLPPAVVRTDCCGPITDPRLCCGLMSSWF